MGGDGHSSLPFPRRLGAGSAARSTDLPATCGDAHAQSRLGDLYRVGDEFTEQDYVEAIHWYGLAAAEGDPSAQNDLGSMYLNGMGVPKDAAHAATWYRRAAEQGLAVAQFNLALRYLHGDGVEQDDHEAAAWLLLATKQGHVEAIGQLGTLYRFGRGVAQDLAAASQLHVIGAAAGDPVALGNLSDYLHDLEQIALGGNPSASLSLATMYDKGLAVEQDQPTALAWLAWGKARCSDCDEATRTELLTMYDGLVTNAEKSVRRRAAHLLKNMRWQPVRLQENPISKREVLIGWDGKPLIDNNGNPLYDDMYDDFGSKEAQVHGEELYQRVLANRKPKPENKG